ncbi:MAG: GAF domain-containing protein [Deltaproteobacteria bacterium]|nr:MAG: GAF domain-containing protein [Deltaproteobacteria bacterium]
MIFNVTIPNLDDRKYATTFQVDARNWRLALQTGLQQEGTALDSLDGFSVESRGETVLVTDPRTRRVYTIVKGQDITSRAAEVLKAASGGHATVSPPGAAPVPGDDEPTRPQAARLASTGTGNIVFKDRNTGSFRAIGAAPAAAPPMPSDHEPTGRIITESRATTGPVDIEAARAIAEGKAPPPASQPIAVASSALEDVFLDIMTIFEPGYPLEDAIDYVLNLGVNNIPCEHGALFFANDDATSLYAATASGPRKDAFMEFDISIDAGLPALAMREGFTLNMQEPASDPRHTPEIEQRMSFSIASAICAPVQFEGRAFGAIALFNRKGGAFPPEEANILAYIGQQMGKFIQLQLDAQPL